MRTPRVVQICESVGESRPEMQERHRGAPRHPRVSVGGAGAYALEQAEHRAHPGDTIQRGDQRHLGGSGIGETCVDACRERDSNQVFRAVHLKHS